MAVQLRVTGTDGNVRVLTLENGQAYNVKAGDRVEVLAENGQVAKATVQGDHVLLQTPGGDAVELKNFVQALKGTGSVELVMPEPQTMQVRVTGPDGESRVRTIKPGEKFVAGAGDHVQVLGASIPSKFEANGKDITFTTTSGSRFTIANVAGEDGAPRPDKVSFPDLFQFGSAAAGGDSTLNLQPLGLVPLNFDASNAPRLQTPTQPGNGTILAMPGHDDGGQLTASSPANGAGTEAALGHVGSDAPAESAPAAPSAPAPAAQSPNFPASAPSLPNNIQVIQANLTPPAAPAPVTPEAPAPAAPAPAEQPAAPPVPGPVTETPATPDAPPPAPPAAGGGVSAPSAPSAPTYLGLTADTDTGTSLTDGLTGDATPTFHGTAMPGVTVHVLLDGVEVGTALADVQGLWSLTPTVAIADGPYVVTTYAADADGRKSGETVGVPLTIDATAASAPVMQDITDETNSASDADLLTNVDLPVITGTAEDAAEGDAVTLYQGDTDVVVGTGTVQADGTWAITLTEALTGSDNDFTVTTTDAAGNESDRSDTFTVSYDAEAPSAPVVQDITDDSNSASDEDLLTNVDLPVVTGTAEDAAEVDGVTLYQGDTDVVVGTGTVAEDGTWSVTLTTALADGENHLTATITDAAGNEGDRSGTFTIDYDATASAAPEIQDITDGTNSASDEDLLTNEGKPTLTGTAEDADEGDVVTLYQGDTDVVAGTGMVAADGTWEVTLTTALTGTDNDFTATTTDAAGNESDRSDTFTVSYDAETASAPVVQDITDESNSGSDDDLITSEAKPTLTGEAEDADEGDVVTVYQDDTDVVAGTGTVKADGTWEITLTEALAGTDNDFTVTTTDAAGNESDRSDTFTVSYDAEAPSAPVVQDLTDDSNSGSDDDLITKEAKPTLRGTAEDADEGDVVTVYQGDTDVVAGTGTVQADGTWEVTLTSALTGTDNDFTVTVTDTAGNESDRSETFTVTYDATASAAPEVVDITDGSNSGSDDDLLTNEAKPALTGTAEDAAEGDVVTVYQGDTDVVAGTGTVAADGTWEVTLTEALTGTDNDFTVTTTDTAGNESDRSGTFTITYDATAPSAPVVEDITDGSNSGSDDDLVTNEAKPTLTGEAEDADEGDVVTVYQGDSDVVAGTGTVKADGTWEVTLTEALSESGGAPTDNDFTVTVTDEAGNVSDRSDTFTVIHDKTAASAPLVQDITDETNSGSDEDLITNEAKPTLTGEAEGATEGDVVTVYQGDTDVVAGTGTVKADGTWEVTLTAALTGTDNDFTVTTTDTAGNESERSDTFTITYDATAPSAPVVEDITDGSNSGSDEDLITNEAKPTLTGTAEDAAEGDVVTVYQGDSDVVAGTGTVAADGTWEVTLTTALTGTDNDFTVTVTDTAGNEGDRSDTFTVTYDATAPDSPVVTGLTASTDNGTFNDDEQTNVTRPTIVGTASEAGAIEVFKTIGGTTTSLGVTTAAANAEGDIVWALDVATDLAPGTYDITAKAVDAAGNRSDASDPLPVVIDTEAPLEGAVTVIGLEADSNTASKLDQTTSIDTPVLIGTATSGLRVEVYEGGTLLGSVTAVDDAWRLPLATELADGVHRISAKVFDAAGNFVEATEAVDVTIDTAKPDAPLVQGISQIVGVDSGVSQTDGYTHVVRPTIHGTGEPGTTVTLYDNNVPLNLPPIAVDADGNWSVTIPNEVDGLGATAPINPHTLTATATDVAGNVSDRSTGVVVTVDTLAPAAPQIDGLSAASNSGDQTDAVTSARVPTLTGTAEAGATVEVFAQVGLAAKVLIGTVTADANQVWRLPIAEALAEDTHVITARAIDKAGNTSDAAPGQDALTLTIDATAPGQPTIDPVGPDTGNGQAGTTTDGITRTATPVLTGTVSGNAATVTVFDGGTPLGTATVTGTSWSLTLSTPLAEGAHSLTAVAADVAGNVGDRSAARTVTIKTSTPTPTVNGMADIESATHVSGTAEPGALISVVLDGATGSPFTTTADAVTGAWSLSGHQLSTASHTVAVTATDVAGNTATTGTVPLIVRDVPPAPVVLGLDAGSDTGTIGDGLTHDDTPRVHGTGEPGTTVQVYVDGVAIGTPVAVVDGKWHLDLTSALADGDHVVSAITLQGGRPSGLAAPKTITIDDTVVVAPVITGLQSPTDTGVSAADGITSTPVPVLEGYAEALSTVTIVRLGANGAETVVGTLTADGDGNWQLPLSGLADGSYTYLARSNDAADNGAVASTSFTVTLDRSYTGQPIVTGLTTDTNSASTGDQITNVAAPTLHGQAEANDMVAVYRNNGTVLVGRAQADGTGKWSLPLTETLAEGDHTFKAVATDLAGNASPESVGRTVTIDTIAPAVPTIATTTVTALATVPPTFTVTVGGKAEADSTVSIYDGATVVGTATADGSGNWSQALAFGAGIQAAGLSVVATDAAGNQSAGSPTTVVNLAPSLTAPVIHTDVTGASTPITGTAPPNVKLTIVIGAVSGTVQSDADGNWTFTPPKPLAPGTTHTVVATIVGHPALTATEGVAIAAKPDAPVITHLTTEKVALADVETDTGLSKTDWITKDTTPVVAGTKKAGTVVDVYVNGALAGTTSDTELAKASTSWTFAIVPGLNADALNGADFANGTKPVITAKARNVAGQESIESNAKVVTVDTSAPGTPQINGLTPETGKEVNDVAYTKLTQPTITGSAEAGATVTVYSRTGTSGSYVYTPLGTTKADNQGNWKVKLASPVADAHDLVARAVDAAGNESGYSINPKRVTVETTAPQVGLALDKTDALEGAVGNATHLAKAKVWIDAVPGATVTVYVDGKKDSVVTATSAHFSHPLTTSLGEGAHEITAVQVTPAGNTSTISPTPLVVTYYTDKLHHPVAVHMHEDADLYAGTSLHDRVTSNPTPKIYGKTQEPNKFVDIYHEGLLIGSTPTASDKHGLWEFTLPASLGVGDHHLTLKTRDAAGHVSKGTGHVDVTIVEGTGLTLKAAAPALDVNSDSNVTTDNFTNNPMPLIKGAMVSAANASAIAGAAKVQVYVDRNRDGDFDDANEKDGLPVAVASTGAFLHQIATPLADGKHAIAFRPIDALGQEGAVSASLTVEVSQSTAVAVTGVVGQTITGTATAKARIAILFDGETMPHTFNANDDGTWSFTPSTALAATTDFTVTASNLANLTQTAQATGTVTVGGGDPGPAPVANVTGVSGDTDTTTQISTPTLTGTSTATGADTVQIRIDGAIAGLATIGVGGAWTFTPLQSLAVNTLGNPSYTVSAEVLVGGTTLSTATGGQSVELVIESGGPVLNTTNPTFSAAGAQVVLDEVVIINQTGGAGPQQLYTVTEKTMAHGNFYKKIGQQAEEVLGVNSTFTQKNLEDGYVYYRGNAASPGDDTIKVRLDASNGTYAYGTVKVDFTGAVTYVVLPTDGPDSPIALTPGALFAEPALDFTRVDQLPGLPKPAVAVGSGDWQAEVRALLNPAAPLQPESLDQAVLTKVLAQTTGHTPSLFTNAPEAVAVVPQAAQAMDALGGLGNAYTQLLDHAGYTLQ